MHPQNPSRRRLLGGLLAGLFGWLATGKTAARPPAPQPAAAPQWLYSQTFSYNANGERTAATGTLSCRGVTRFHYDAQNRLTTITHGR